MDIKALKKILFALWLFEISVMTGPVFCRAQENGTGTETAVSQEDGKAEKEKQPGMEAMVPVIPLVTDQEEVKKLDEKAAQTEEMLKQKAAEVQKAQKEAEQVLTEKAVLEQEAQVKEKAAEVAKQELAVIKKEAVVTRDAEALAKAEKLSREASQLEKEAAIQKQKVAVMDTKAQAAKDAAAAHQAGIDALRVELAKLKQEKSSKRGLIDRLISGAVIIVIGMILFFLMNFGVKKFEHLITEKDAIRESEKTLQIKTIAALFKWLGSLIIVGIIVYMFLENFGFNMAPLLAGAGIMGLAFGFGGQYLIRDIINGIFILLEGQYRINDVVKIGETGGLVEGVNLRITRLRDLEGRVIFIPNGEVKTVINYTKEYAQALLDIGVAYKEDVDQVMQVMKDVSKEMREDSYFGRLILGDMEMLGVDNFADSAVVIKCRMKTLPIKQWEVMREYRRRLKNRFDELGIEIPFPHTTVYWGMGKDNDWWRQKYEAGQKDT